MYSAGSFKDIYNILYFLFFDKIRLINSMLLQSCNDFLRQFKDSDTYTSNFVSIFVCISMSIKASFSLYLSLFLALRYIALFQHLLQLYLKQSNMNIFSVIIK